MRPQVRLLTVFLAALVAVLAVAGCGGGGASDTEDQSASAILQKTFGSDATIHSGRLTLGLDADVREGVQGVSGPVKVRLTGPFESSDDAGKLPKFAFTLSVSGSGQDINAGATSTGDKGFLMFQGTDYAVPDAMFEQFEQGYAEAQKQSKKDTKDHPTLKALGIDPLAWVTDPKKAGEAEVGGAETVHITAGIDVPRLLDDVRKTLARAGSASAATGLSDTDVETFRKSVKSAKVDVFTGKDDARLRKLVVDLRLESGKVAFTLELADLDEEQDIQAPTDAKPIQDLVAQFQAATGAGTGAGGSGSGSGSAGSATGGANQKYLECVQAAGQDLAKVQACAKYL
jgi:hypothetical protein